MSVPTLATRPAVQNHMGGYHGAVAVGPDGSQLTGHDLGPNIAYLPAGGTSWKRSVLTNDNTFGRAIFAIAHDLSQPGVVYAALAKWEGDGGGGTWSLWKHTDYGDTDLSPWVHTYTSPANQAPQAGGTHPRDNGQLMQVHPETGTILVASYDGLVRSIDGGQTFNARWFSTRGFKAIHPDPVNPNHLYCAIYKGEPTQLGVFRLENAFDGTAGPGVRIGTTGFEIPTDLSAMEDPGNPGETILIVTEYSQPGTGVIFRSKFAGSAGNNAEANWENLTPDQAVGVTTGYACGIHRPSGFGVLVPDASYGWFYTNDIANVTPSTWSKFAYSNKEFGGPRDWWYGELVPNYVPDPDIGGTSDGVQVVFTHNGMLIAGRGGVYGNSDRGGTLHPLTTGGGGAGNRCVAFNPVNPNQWAGASTDWFLHIGELDTGNLWGHEPATRPEGNNTAQLVWNDDGTKLYIVSWSQTSPFQQGGVYEVSGNLTGHNTATITQIPKSATEDWFNRRCAGVAYRKSGNTEFLVVFVTSEGTSPGGDEGIWRSTNTDGAGWTDFVKSSYVPADPDCENRRIPTAWDNGVADHVYAYWPENGLLHSSNFGVDWAVVNNDAGIAGGAALYEGDFKLDPTDQTRGFLIGTDGSAYRFTLLRSGTPTKTQIGAATIADAGLVAVNQLGQVFVITKASLGTKPAKVFCSDNAGSSFVDVTDARFASAVSGFGWHTAATDKVLLIGHQGGGVTAHDLTQSPADPYYLYSPSYLRNRVGSVNTRLRTVGGAAAEYAKRPTLKGIAILSEARDWHVGEGSFSSAHEALVAGDVADACVNDYKLMWRIEYGSKAPTWPSWSVYNLIAYEGHTPITVPQYTDPEYWRLYLQGLARRDALLKQLCPNNPAHIWADHLVEDTISFATVLGTEMIQKNGIAGVYVDTNNVVRPALTDTQTGFWMDAARTPEHPAGECILRVDDEYLYQVSCNAGGYVTLADDGRGWNGSKAVAHDALAPALVADPAGGGNLVGPFAFPAKGKSTVGYWDEAVTNENEYLDQLGDLVTRRALVKEAWRQSIVAHAEQMVDVEPSDKMHHQSSVAGGDLWGDNWAAADELAREFGPRYSGRITWGTTNIEDNYPSASPNAHDFLEQASRHLGYVWGQSRGTSFWKPVNEASMNRFVEAQEDTLERYALSRWELSPELLGDDTDFIDVGVIAPYKAMTETPADDEHCNIAVGTPLPLGGGDVAHTDEFQGRMLPLIEVAEGHKDVTIDQQVVAGADVNYDAITHGPGGGGVVGDVKNGFKAARFDLTAAAGDVYVAWGNTFGTHRFASLDGIFLFEQFDTAIAQRLYRFAQPANVLFGRIGLDGVLNLFDGTSQLAGMTVPIMTDRWVRIAMWTRAATAAEPDQQGLATLALWNDIGHPYPTELITVGWDSAENAVTRGDIGSVGRGASVQANSFWMRHAAMATSGLHPGVPPLTLARPPSGEGAKDDLLRLGVGSP